MSEEILKAMMQLFALITKQDGGIGKKEVDYVYRFLVQQIGVDSAGEYLKLYEDTAYREDSDQDDRKRLTSVLDSVKVLVICKKISKTINQSQKVVVVVRILELINAEYKLTEQRLGIVQTVAQIFRINKEEYEAIETFVTSLNEEDFTGDGHMVVPGYDAPLFFLRVPSVELYFVKYSGKQEAKLNGLNIHSGTIYLFASGSSLKMAVGQPIYYSDIATRFMAGLSQELIMLEAKKLCYNFPGGATGLHDISFAAEQGNLVAIMGSSGSGKTTLLNAMSGMNKPASGSVEINKLDLWEDKDKLSGVTGYVPQDDLLIEELSIFDNLWYNAKFCFKDLPDHEIQEKVDQTLSSLGLLEKKDLRVGSPMNKTISGGQRKRLNIALELIRQPSILFLDEPTSGLSSRDSEIVLDLLRELTLKGKLVFVVIHQPSSELYKMFDKVVVLDNGGRLIYYGNPVEAVVHFKKVDNQVNATVGECQVCGNVNPEQIFNIVEARQVDEYGNYIEQRKIQPETWEDIYQDHKDPVEVQHPETAPPSNLNVPGWFGQLFNYLKRDIKSKTNNSQYLVMTLLVSPALAFILSFIIRYKADPTSNIYILRENENIPIYIFMALIVALFLGLIVSAEEIFKDRKILKREQFLNLSRSSYLLAKIGNLLTISAIQAISFVLIANGMLEIRDMTLSYWLALFSTAVFANMMGLVISSAFSSAVTIYIVIPLVMIPMMVLSGAMFSFEKLNRRITTVDKVPLIAEMMPTKWAYEALMVNQFKNNTFESAFYDYEKAISRNNFKSAYLIPELEERLKLCIREFRENGNITKQKNALAVLRNEILASQGAVKDIRFKEEELMPGQFSEAGYKKISAYLAAWKQYHISKFSSANRKKDLHLSKLMKDRRELYFEMLDKYHNESVSDHVKKIYEKTQIIESEGRLYQQIDPIFMDPGSEGFIGIRSHFFAPRKYFMGRYVNTFAFNIGFIWFLTLALYMILYYDLAGRLIRKKYLSRIIRN